MKVKQIFLFTFSFFLFSFSFLHAQEHYDHLLPLKTNPALVNYVKQVKKTHGFVWRLISDSIVLNLPFLDDFSGGGPYPDTALWLDNAAFINNTYPICPPTIGVATLDGVNNEGQPYNPNCPPGSSYPADSLTSRPINMAPYNDNESVWLTFYWQAGGRGMAPLTSDTLLLQFRTGKTPWTTIWYQLGYTPVPPDTGFHLVMIPMTDTIHEALDSNGRFNSFDGNFQFRFKNYACTSANADQWNIDMVSLAEHWIASDTALANTSFVYESPSLLANYEYMPWEQFTANDLRDNMYMQMRNNGIAIANVTYNYTINTTPVSTLPLGGITDNMNTFYTSGYDTVYAQTHPAIKSNFNYTPLSGPDTITITHYIKNSNEFIKSDDTLKFNQVFSDFYAYDDGTAEASYFINGTTPIDLAEGFTLNNPDTLRGLELYFNYMFVNPANYNMILAVWDNTGPGGTPGHLIYENPDSDVSAPRTSDTLNGFTFYPYSSPLITTAGETIYVGWIQTNGDSLNIGFDLNTNSQNQIYYNVNTYPGGWQTCTYPGSLMMRPVFGHSNAHSFVKQQQDSSEAYSSYESIRIYPNPANDMVNFSAPMPPNTTLKIYTADGREYVNNSDFYGNSINTSALPAGFYILEVTPQGGQTFYQKLLIQR